MKTFSTKAGEIKRTHHVIDASDRVLGKLAVEVATLLMGKNKPVFTRHLDTGDFVTVINAEKIKISGNKINQKFYYRHSGYPGGFRAVSMAELMDSDPTRVIEYAVKGMLPPNRLRARLMGKLTVYPGSQVTEKKPAKASEIPEQKG